jgi:hypothetical protein
MPSKKALLKKASASLFALLHADRTVFGGDEQDKVMAGYIAQGAVKNKDDQGKLHMFFSPNRVPKGMTNEQVRICINLCFLRDRERKLQLKYGGIRAISNGGRTLPVELRPVDEPVHPEAFKIGLAKFHFEFATYELACLNSPNQPPINDIYVINGVDPIVQIIEAYEDGNLTRVEFFKALRKWKRTKSFKLKKISKKKKKTL